MVTPIKSITPNGENRALFFITIYAASDSGGMEINMTMDDSYWALGHKLRNLRTSNGYTMQAVANALGVSAQFISMVERGKSGISLSKLQKLMSFYGLTLADLVEEKNPSDRVVRLNEAKKLGYDIEGVEARSIIADPDKKKPSMAYFRLQPNASIGFMQHEGIEILFVIDGTLQFQLIDSETDNQEEYTLSSGDTIHHPSFFKHKCTNISNKVALILVISYQ